MKVKFVRNKGSNTGVLIATREKSDPKYYSESTLLYNITKTLKAKGYDVIKKPMWKDGHMMGDDRLNYIRSRNRDIKKNPKGFLAYDDEYAIRALYEPWNKKGEVRLSVIWNK